MKKELLAIEGFKGTQYQMSEHDTRKPTLTLKHLNKLKKYRELNKLEAIKTDEVVKQMYASKPEG